MHGQLCPALPMARVGRHVYAAGYRRIGPGEMGPHLLILGPKLGSNKFSDYTGISANQVHTSQVSPCMTKLDDEISKLGCERENEPLSNILVGCARLTRKNEKKRRVNHNMAP